MVATGVWSGNHDGSPIGSSNNAVRRVANNFMEGVHKNIYQPEGKWKPNDWFAQPAGIQKLTVKGKTDLWPSWYKKPQEAEGVKMMFDKVSKKKATQCTPERAKQEVTVQKTVDPITKKESFSAPDGFNATADDDAHNCSDVKPSVVDIAGVENGAGSKQYKLTASVTQGTKPLQSVEFTVNGQAAGSVSANNSGDYSITYTAQNAASISVGVTVIDQAYYDSTYTKQLTITTASNSNNREVFDKPRQHRNLQSFAWQN